MKDLNKYIESISSIARFIILCLGMYAAFYYICAIWRMSGIGTSYFCAAFEGKHYDGRSFSEVAARSLRDIFTCCVSYTIMKGLVHSFYRCSFHIVGFILSAFYMVLFILPAFFRIITGNEALFENGFPDILKNILFISATAWVIIVPILDWISLSRYIRNLLKNKELTS